ncbi:histidine kinase [Spirosoma harenae]
MQRLNEEFVFSNQPRQRLARHGLFWLVWAIFFTITYGFLPANYLIHEGVAWPTALLKGFFVSGIDSVLFMPAHMFLSYSLMYWVIPRYLMKGRYLWVVMSTIVLVVLTAFISAVIAEFIVYPVRMFIHGRYSGNSFFFAMMAGMRGATTIAGFAVAIKLVKIWYRKQEAFQQVEREKLQAELQLLKSQIHPHFLFNTLNNLYALTLQKADHSPEVVVKLSELLRYMLYDCNAPEVSLQKEIEFMRNYIGLEQLRYGDRLDLSLTITGNYQHKLIAPLLLIPFLENAFKHGTSEQLEQSWMHVDLSVQGNQLKFKVINSREPSSDDSAKIGGIGLQNVKKRLNLLYEKRHELRIISEGETFMVALIMELAPIEIVQPIPTIQLIETV